MINSDEWLPASASAEATASNSCVGLHDAVVDVHALDLGGTLRSEIGTQQLWDAQEKCFQSAVGEKPGGMDQKRVFRAILLKSQAGRGAASPVQ